MDTNDKEFLEKIRQTAGTVLFIATTGKEEILTGAVFVNENYEEGHWDAEVVINKSFSEDILQLADDEDTIAFADPRVEGVALYMPAYSKTTPLLLHNIIHSLREAVDKHVDKVMLKVPVIINPKIKS